MYLRTLGRPALGWVEMIELRSLSAGWKRSSWFGSRLAGRNRVWLALGWLDVIKLVWLWAG
jgi:hypothetical protein